MFLMSGVTLYLCGVGFRDLGVGPFQVGGSLDVESDSALPQETHTKRPLLQAHTPGYIGGL